MSMRARSILVAVAAGALALLSVAPAGAAPVLDLQMTRTAAPVTHSDERLAYDLTVKNTASGNPSLGTQLTCLGTPVDGKPTNGTPAPSLEVQWLRNGAPIPGSRAPAAATAGGNTYTVTAADEGKSIQCEVFGTNDADGAGGVYAPITHATVSVPPIAVEPIPTPSLPSGSESAAIKGQVAAPEGTATFSAASGEGTLSAGSATVTGVSASNGAFAVGQGITGPGIPTGAGTGVITEKSKTITGVNTSSGEFSVGQRLGALELVNGTTPSGSPIGWETTIAAVGSGTIEMTVPALRSSSLVRLTANTTIAAVGAGTLELSSKASASGAAPLSAGSLELSDVVTVKGSGNLTAGSTTVSGLNTTKGIFFARGGVASVAIIGPGIAAAMGAGNLVAGSKSVTGVTTDSGAFAVGESVAGPGIGELTTIKGVGPGELTLSAAPTASTLHGRLQGFTAVTAATATTLTLSVPASATTSGAQLTGASLFSAGQSVTGSGIAPGTLVNRAAGSRVELSAPVTASGSEATVAGSSTITCVLPSGWVGTGLTWSFQWLRNGQAIPGAETSTYVIHKSETDTPADIQCEATVKDAAGNEAATISGPGSTLPQPPSPYAAPGSPQGGAAITFNNKSEGPVTVEAQLPPGTKALRAVDSQINKVWTCSKTVSVATCTRSDSLAPGASYSPITLVAQVLPGATDALRTEACAAGGGAVAPSCAEDEVTGILPAVPFGFKAFNADVLDELGADFTQAGGHPFSVDGELVFTDHVRGEPSGEAGSRAANGFVRDIDTDLPPGFTGNPEALEATCPTVSDVIALPSTCPAGSAVGAIKLETEQGTFVNRPVFALTPERGTPAQLAFGIAQIPPGFVYTLTAGLRPSEGYAVRLAASPVQKFPELFGAALKVCSFGAVLGPDVKDNGELEFKRCRKPSEPEAMERPFLSLPTRCGDPASSTTRVSIDSWEEPGDFRSAEFTAPALTGCDALEFAPTLKARPTTNVADSPSGLEVDLHIPQNEDPEGTATAHLKKTVVTLPPGLVVNPAGANGLDACSPSQMGLGTNDPVTCPEASKVGTVEVDTPILDHPLPGVLYIATPHQNPFGTLLALYLVVEDPQTGITVKLPGRVDPDPQSGQITTTFDENPQAPIEDVRLRVRAGASAPLRTPATCGTYSTTSQLTPWSAPDSGPPATPSDSYQISQAPGGGACAGSPGGRPNAPSLEAGTSSPLAGTYAPFVVRLKREDGSQEFSTVTVTPPPGLVAKLAGTATCSDSALAAAAANTGAEEKASPSCPAASQLGSVVAGAGAGPAPYYATGKAYLTGPYKGAPLSMAVITPAVAGPFDVGTIVVRVALYFDPVSAKVTAKSDPLPTILDGIPLDIRSTKIALDRPNFTLNPTNCSPTEVSGQLLSTEGQAAALANRFQVGECGALKFKPELKLRLRGSTKRGGYEALTATVTYPKGSGYANIASASVALPHSAFLAQEHIRTICTRVQFAAHQCPAGSIYGRATATTPLLDQPLSGPVYLRSSDNPLPDLVVALRGSDAQPIEVDLAGRTDSVHGGIRNTFDVVPDAPVSEFTLQLLGGQKSLIVNSRDLCAGTQRATARFVAQNGMRLNSRPIVANDCGKQNKHSKHRAKKTNTDRKAGK